MSGDGDPDDFGDPEDDEEYEDNCDEEDDGELDANVRKYVASVCERTIT